MSNILRKLGSASKIKKDLKEMGLEKSLQNHTPKETNRLSNTFIPNNISNSNSVLTSDVEFNGEIEFENNLTVLGKIKGKIKTTGNLSFEKTARINAHVHADNLVIKGDFKGTIKAGENVSLLSGASIIGDIQAKTIKIEDGVTFVGKATIKKDN